MKRLIALAILSVASLATIAPAMANERVVVVKTHRHHHHRHHRTVVVEHR